jgi:hypothetical protein
MAAQSSQRLLNIIVEMDLRIVYSRNRRLNSGRLLTGRALLHAQQLNTLAKGERRPERSLTRRHEKTAVGSGGSSKHCDWISNLNSHDSANRSRMQIKYDSALLLCTPIASVREKVDEGTFSNECSIYPTRYLTSKRVGEGASLPPRSANRARNPMTSPV